MKMLKKINHFDVPSAILAQNIGLRILAHFQTLCFLVKEWLIFQFIFPKWAVFCLEMCLQHNVYNQFSVFRLFYVRVFVKRIASLMNVV